MMRKMILTTLIAMSLVTIATMGPASAHHSFAMFDLSQHQLVEGRITDWHYNSPHSWLYIDAVDENGQMQRWSFEGAAPVHATRQGVTGNTFRKSEVVRVVMSPIRDGRRAGAMCFVVKEDNSIVRPNDATCNSVGVIETWQSSGWLESTEHLGRHPAEP